MQSNGPILHKKGYLGAHRTMHEDAIFISVAYFYMEPPALREAAAFLREMADELRTGEFGTDHVHFNLYHPEWREKHPYADLIILNYYIDIVSYILSLPFVDDERPEEEIAREEIKLREEDERRRQQEPELPYYELFAEPRDNPGQIVPVVAVCIKMEIRSLEEIANFLELAAGKIERGEMEEPFIRLSQFSETWKFLEPDADFVVVDPRTKFGPKPLAEARKEGRCDSPAGG